MSNSVWKVAPAPRRSLPSTWFTGFLGKAPLSGLSVSRLASTVLWLADGTLSIGVICLEEFREGSMIARLSCLCSFHNSETFTSFIAPITGAALTNGTRLLTYVFSTS